MVVSRFGSSGDASTRDFHDGVDVIRWKLYGKNKAFDIMHDAACTIQALWRGCIARAATTQMIQHLIDDITAFRQLEAEYRRKDAEDRRQYQLEHTSNDDSKDDVEAKNESCPHAQSGLARRRKKSKPWQIATKDNGSDEKMIGVVTPPRKVSEDSGNEETMVSVVTPTRKTVRFRETMEVEFLGSEDIGFFKSLEDDTRGYRRYRTNIHGKNKTRPWRDDTNVFDAF